MIANRRLDQITVEDIKALVDASYAEDREIDYKRELPDLDGKKRDDARKKLLADVASFANAGGGDILFGVEEGRDAEGKANGIPVGLPGVVVDNLDALQRRWLGIVESGLDPRMAPKIRMSVVELPGTGVSILVLRVPRSYPAPHMVTESGRFHVRHGPENRTLNTAEIRDAFGVSERWAERIRRFRDERLGRFLGGEQAISTPFGPHLIVHGVPMSSMGAGTRVDLQSIKSIPPKVYHQHGPFDVRFNVDGLLLAAGNGQFVIGYLQLFRDGCFEFVATIKLATPNFVYLQKVEPHIEHCATKTTGCLVENGASYPFAILPSLVGVKGLQAAPLRGFDDPFAPLDRDTLLLPDVVLHESVGDSETLRPIMDALWQCFGFEKSWTWKAGDQE